MHQHRFGDSDLGFGAWIWRGDDDGPVLLLNGATHGDEYEGPTLLRRWIDDWRPSELHGTVIAVPVLNEAAFAAGSRCTPADEGNLARAFPGHPEGTPTSRLAHLFETQVLAHATHYVDFHSGGHAMELVPWVGYITGGAPEVEKTQRDMAACFDQLWCWAGPYLPGRTLSAAHQRSIPALYTESTGKGGLIEDDVATLDRGLRHLLVHLGMVSGEAPDLTEQRFCLTTDAGDTNLQIHHPAPHDGLFEARVTLGTRVTAKQELGVVWPLHDATPTPILAEHAGTVVLRRHQRSVHRGNALFTLADL